ncbi:MlaD family protein [Candidatus Palauibacter sp.]|uniref:MlaD family protein n=1 Tax=Candidatus Palauibacter sp. TaxID=3101350 RepID=UPI003B5BDF0D
MAATDLSSKSARGRARTGLVLIAVSMLLGGAVFFSDLIIRASLEGARITVLTHSAAGIGPGSAVWLAGRPVGRVLSISFRPVDVSAADAPTHGHVVIEGVIDRAVEPMLRADATVDVRPADILAPVIVALDPGTGTAPPWNFSDTLRASGPPRDPETVMAMADTLFMAARSLEARAAEAGNVIASGQGSIGRFRRNPGALASVKRDLDVLQGILLRDVPRSSLARLAADTLVGPATRRVRERLAEWNASPQRRIARQSLVTATDALDAMVVRLGSLMERVERGEGTAGRVLMDGEIQRQLAALRIAAAELAEDLKYNPSRWLRVRVF